MTDGDLINWLRKHALADDEHEWQLNHAARRLEALLTEKPPLPLTAPMTDDALADVRDEVAEGTCGNPAVRFLMLRDLLALADWEAARADLAESALLDALAEDGRREAGYREAVADVPQHLEAYFAQANGQGEADPRVAFAAGYFGDLRRQLRALNPADLTPHERLRTRVARLEAALREILPLTGYGDGGVSRAVQIARLALGDADA